MWTSNNIRSGTMYYWHLILLVVLVEGIQSATETHSKYACKGHSVQLFSSPIIDTPARQIDLYKLSVSPVLISTWKQGLNIVHGYSKKLFLDHNGDVWIHNISPSDEAKYRLKVIGTESNVKSFDVELNVYASPSVDCKPNIERVKDMLIASLQAEDCGKPAASAYWLDNPAIAYVDSDVIKLPPKNKAGTYYACINSPAVKCGLSSRLSEHCSSFTIDDDVGSESGDESSGQDTERSPLEASFAVLLIGSGMIFVAFVGLFLNICMHFTQFRSIRKVIRSGNEDVPNFLHTTVQKEKVQFAQASDVKRCLSVTDNAAS